MGHLTHQKQIQTWRLTVKWSNYCTPSYEYDNGIFKPISIYWKFFKQSGHILYLEQMDPPDLGILKINIDVYFTEGKIGIVIIFRTTWLFPYWQKKYLELEDTCWLWGAPRDHWGYLMGIPYSEKLLIESDSLIVVTASKSFYRHSWD